MCTSQEMGMKPKLNTNNPSIKKHLCEMSLQKYTVLSCFVFNEATNRVFDNVLFYAMIDYAFSVPVMSEIIIKTLNRKYFLFTELLIRFYTQ